jgi:hypothetical protein
MATVTHHIFMGLFDKLFGKKKPNLDADDFAKQVAGFAEQAVDAARDRGRGVLDYSEESLKIVEDMLEEISVSGAGAKAESMATIFGSYILEVGRRQFGGRYCWYQKGNQPVLVVGEPRFRIAIITLDRVRSRMRGDRADNIPFFFDGFSSGVRKAKPGDSSFHV